MGPYCVLSTFLIFPLIQQLWGTGFLIADGTPGDGRPESSRSPGCLLIPLALLLPLDLSLVFLSPKALPPSVFQDMLEDGQ